MNLCIKLLTKSGSNFDDTVAEWLRRLIRNHLGLSRVGSSPAGVELNYICFLLFWAHRHLLPIEFTIIVYIHIYIYIYIYVIDERRANKINNFRYYDEYTNWLSPNRNNKDNKLNRLKFI